MTQLQIVDINGKNADSMTVRDEIFGVKPKLSVVHGVLVAHLASLRQGSANSKTRGEVSGGGKKPWQQKGTGRARAGDNRSPLWTGGGVTFGPKPRKYTKYVPKKEKRLALRMAISDKVLQNKFVVVDQFNLSGKTKEMASIIKGLGLSGKILILANHENVAAKRAAQNLASVVVKNSTEVNIFDVLKCGTVLAEKSAVNKMQEVLK